jgi:hypothetical protein
VRLGPLPSHQLPVPPKEGFRPDQERTQDLSPKKPARGGEERPVASWLQPSPSNAGDSEQRSTNSSQGRLRPPLIV